MEKVVQTLACDIEKKCMYRECRDCSDKYVEFDHNIHWGKFLGLSRKPSKLKRRS